MNIYSYLIGEKLYINLTNRCTNSCDFCIRNTEAFSDLDLWLSKEPSFEEVINSFPDLNKVEEEVVFCGFGEPTYRFEILTKVAEYLHLKGKKTRLNTNGQSMLISEDYSPSKLRGLIDVVSISLNAVNNKKYNEICHPEHGLGAFDAILRFAKESKKYIPKVILTVVDVISLEDQLEAKRIAEELGVEFRLRKYENQ